MVVNKRRPNPAVLAAIENTLFREAYKGALINGSIAFVVGTILMLVWAGSLPSFLKLSLACITAFIALVATYDLIRGTYHLMLRQKYMKK